MHSYKRYLSLAANGMIGISSYASDSQLLYDPDTYAEIIAHNIRNGECVLEQEIQDFFGTLRHNIKNSQFDEAAELESKSNTAFIKSLIEGLSFQSSISAISESQKKAFENFIIQVEKIGEKEEAYLISEMLTLVHAKYFIG